VDELAWILRDGDRDLVRLEAPLRKDGGWTEYRVVGLGVPRLDGHLASNLGAEARLSAHHEVSGTTLDEVTLRPADPHPDGAERVQARGLDAKATKPRGLWAVVYEWMSRM